MDRKYSHLSLPLIKEALRGFSVRLDESPDGKQTYGQYLEKGFYLNTIEGSSHLVPRISPLQLMLYALDNAITNPSSEDGQCAKVILRLFRLEENFTWQQILFSGEPKNTRTIEELENIDHEKLEQIKLAEYALSKDNLSQSVIVPAIGNPGFDIVCFEVNQTNVSEPIIICAECRLSDPEEGDKRKKKEKEAMPLTKADIKQKRDLTVRQFRPYFRKGATLCGFTLKEENLFLVLCAFRKINENALEDLPANTIVLDRQQLETLYTPSLPLVHSLLLKRKEDRIWIF